MKSILLTGVTGFIGGHTARKLLDHELTVLVRPGKTVDLPVRSVEIDLRDGDSLVSFLNRERFDAIVHIGALRGGRTSSHAEYQRVNIDATQRLVEGAIRHGSRFVYCSSVGVFGAIPVQCPARDQTPRKEDTFYHVTKIRGEELVRKQAEAGRLDGCILRPAITYGVGDYGFPYTLTRLIDKRLLFYPTRPFKIHMTNLESIAEAFVQAIDKPEVAGKAWTVADSEPVVFRELVDFISRRLHGRDYPASRRVPRFLFGLGQAAAKLVRNELWMSRFELISQDWYYDVADTYRDFDLPESRTLEQFGGVIDWYRSLKTPCPTPGLVEAS